MSDRNTGQDGQRARRTALSEQLSALGEAFSTETALFHQAAAATYGLGITDMKTLSVLTQEGPMTAGLLAQRLSLTTGAVTNVIDRLARRDLVERRPDPDDRRKVIVVANQQTLASRKNVYLSIGAAFEALFETYTIAELELLVRFYTAAIELNQRETAKLAQTGT